MVALKIKANSNLREACVEEAISIIADVGLASLSLREVARRLGVSHQAPYKHFPSRDHILAEVVGRAFASFSAQLEKHARGSDPYEDLGNLGRSYLDYARKHPLQYQLMFGMPLPDPKKHPDMMIKAEHAFNMLQEAITKLPGHGPDANIELDALYVWSVVHGLAGLFETGAAKKLGISKAKLADATNNALSRIGRSLGQHNNRL
jgi:AcrR family transcriptional regulator